MSPAQLGMPLACGSSRNGLGGHPGKSFRFGAVVQFEPVVGQEGLQMLHYAVVFFIIALIAAVFGFGGIAVGAAEIAKVLFFIFLILFVASLVVGLFRRGN